jgi:hypothetical protein
MSEFLYIYRGPQSPSDPQEAQQLMQKWMTWLEDLAKRGKIKDRGGGSVEVRPIMKF